MHGGVDEDGGANAKSGVGVAALLVREMCDLRDEEAFIIEQAAHASSGIPCGQVTQMKSSPCGQSLEPNVPGSVDLCEAESREGENCARFGHPFGYAPEVNRPDSDSGTR